MSTTTLQTYFEPMKFIPPTLDEVKERANTIGLPMREAEKFFLYYESNGWKTGRTKMQKWTMALAGWKLRYEERQPQNGHTNGQPMLTKAQEIFYSKELDKKQTKLEDLEYNGKQYGWTDALRTERQALRVKIGEIKKLLGITL